MLVRHSQKSVFQFSLFTPQIVKALEHLHSNLSVIHRGKRMKSSVCVVFSFPAVVSDCWFPLFSHHPPNNVSLQM